jgi:D-2-hydroxyacid dehydrogenase (NADP+)
MAAMTMLHSDFARYLVAQQAQRWERHPVGTLQGKTLAIVGLGAIGGEIAQRARAFGMRVLGVSRGGTPAAGCERVYATRDLHLALALADFVTVVVPLTEETRGLVDARAFAAMMPGARLVNVARGGVVDEDALLAGLRSGQVAGACLDVFAQEPLPAAHPLWSAPNVIVTPHIAGYREDYVERALDVFADNLARFEAGTPLANVVHLDRGY